jgi:hypothetical protein
LYSIFFLLPFSVRGFGRVLFVCPFHWLEANYSVRLAVLCLSFSSNITHAMLLHGLKKKKKECKAHQPESELALAYQRLLAVLH